MPKIILPEVNYNPDFNYNQYDIIVKLQQYLSSTRHGEKLVFDSEDGICSGLAALWLYRKRIGEEGKFLHALEYILQWDAEKFKQKDPANSDKTQHDLLLDEFMNDVLFLQHDKILRHGINQDNLPASFNLLLNDYCPQVSQAEFKMLFVFDRASLATLIENTVFNNKMIRIDNSMHVIALMLSGDKYYFYDPNSKQGPQSYNKELLPQLVNSIFESLNKYCGSEEYLAIYMTAFDITEDTHIVKYPESLDYCKTLLKDPHYKQAVLKHQNIFHLGIRYQAYPTLDLLFATGYNYIPWELHSTTEFDEAIIYDDQQKLEYLIKNKIPIDYRSPSGITPLARAVIEKKPYMLYMLLRNGANPNIEAQAGIPVFNYALIQNDPAYIILLLAAGFKLDDGSLDWLKSKYPDPIAINAIFTHTLLLHSRLMPKQRNISKKILKTLNNTVNTMIKTPFIEHTPSIKQQIDAIAATINELSKIESDIQDGVCAIKQKIDTYLGNMHVRKTLIFSAHNTSTQQNSTYETDVLPLLKANFSADTI